MLLYFIVSLIMFLNRGAAFVSIIIGLTGIKMNAILGSADTLTFKFIADFLITRRRLSIMRLRLRFGFEFMLLIDHLVLHQPVVLLVNQVGARVIASAQY